MSEHDYILYLCDRRACNSCRYPNCQHTRDIRHAKNFSVIDSDIAPRDIKDKCIFVEQESIHAGTQQRG